MAGRRQGLRRGLVLTSNVDHGVPEEAYIAVHASDDYVQMVEYLPMNGLTPPASGAPALPKK